MYHFNFLNLHKVHLYLFDGYCYTSIIYFQSMIVFIKTCGFANTSKLIWQYPAMVLTPIFTFWTMGPKKTASTITSCSGSWTSNDMRIGVSFFYTLFNALITITGSLFCFLVNHRHPNFFSKCSSFVNTYSHWRCQNFLIGCIVIPILLFVAFIFTLILKCTRKSHFCGVPISNVQNFDINEWDVKEGALLGHQQEHKMSESLVS